jgi:hypothetical protein
MCAASEDFMRSRPLVLRTRPVRMDPVFDMPEEVVALIQERAPFFTMDEYHHQLGMPLVGTRTSPWFRTHLKGDIFLQNARWIAAAKEAFSAQIVQPLRCTLNANAPSTAGGPHMDLAQFRGVSAGKVPGWLVMNMGHSGLFLPWMVPLASGLTWFYRGEGGGFEYWPEGPYAPSMVEHSPMWNVGVMSDNEAMYHRVQAIGSAADQQALGGSLKVSDTLHYAGGQTWEIRDGSQVVARFPSDAIRFSLLWKARVFKDEEHLASFEDKNLELDIGHIVEIYMQDLSARGIRVQRPPDPVSDPVWKQTLQDTYSSAFAGTGIGGSKGAYR